MRSSFECYISPFPPLLLARARARDICPGGSVSLLTHNYTQYVAIITLSSVTHTLHHTTIQLPRHKTPPVTKTGSNCYTDRQTDIWLGLLNLWFSYLYIQTLIVLCPYWITGKLSLSFERKILFHSDDNYQFPILFNLYKMWNLLIWVKLLRQRNTPHVLFLFSTPT